MAYTVPYASIDSVSTAPTSVAGQVRQSKAGHPGKHRTAVDAMGTNAPAAAVTAQNLTVVAQAAKEPFTIEGGVH